MSLLSGKYGRRPPKNAPALRFGNFYRRGTAPPSPATVDYLAALHGGWQMLGNANASDCNAVTLANMRRLVTSTLTARPYYMTQAQVWQFYETQNPGFDPAGNPAVNGPGSPLDGGMDIQTGLEYLHATGGPDGVKAVAFATVDPTNLADVHAALAIFGGLWLGINVLDANQQQFSEGVAWTDVPGSPVDGGHAILAGGYTPDVRFITWAAETEFDPSFWAGVVQGSPLVEEAWAVIWPENLGTRQFEAGINKAQLEADYLEVTHSPLVWPPTPVVPVPVPAPVPAPVVPHDVATMADRIMWATAGPFADAAQTVPHLVILQAALDTWSQAKGL